MAFPAHLQSLREIAMRHAVPRGTPLLLAGFIACAPVGAAPLLNVEVGPSFMNRHATAALFVESVLDERPLGSSRFSWAPDFSVGWIDGRHIRGPVEHGYTPQDTVWLAAAGVRLRVRDSASPWHRWFFSFQPAATVGRTVALSSGYQFVSTFGWQGERCSVQLRHVSNAGLHEPNRGETMLLFGMALRP